MHTSLIAALALAASAATAVHAAPLVSSPPAKRYDDRNLIGFPSQNGTDFCGKWVSDCQAYRPADTQLRYIAARCTPGDYQGQNTDTRALAYCLYGTYTSVLHHVRHLHPQLPPRLLSHLLTLPLPPRSRTRPAPGPFRSSSEG